MAGRSILLLLLNVFLKILVVVVVVVIVVVVLVLESVLVNGCCNLVWSRWTCCSAVETSSRRATCPTWPAWPALTSTKRCAHSTSIIGVFEFRMALKLGGISSVVPSKLFSLITLF